MIRRCQDLTEGETIIVELLRPDVSTKPHVTAAQRPYTSGRVGDWRRAPAVKTGPQPDEEEQAAKAWAQATLGSVGSSAKPLKVAVGPWYRCDTMGIEAHDGNYSGFRARTQLGLGFPPKTRKHNPAGAQDYPWDKSLKAGHMRPSKPRWEDPSSRVYSPPPVAPHVLEPDNKIHDARNAAEKRAAAAAHRAKGRRPPPRPRTAAPPNGAWLPSRTAEGLLFGMPTKRPKSAGAR